MKITVAIATTGRPAMLGEALRDLARQTRLPDRMIVSAAVAEDVIAADLTSGPVPVELIFGRRGTTVQRNAVLDALENEDIVLFLDDDFMMGADFLAGMDRLFRDHPEISVATGHVLADGIKTAGITAPEALSLLAGHAARPLPHDDRLIPVNNGYGCNMAFRCAPIRDHKLRFDENLPLYAWLEDVDFSRKVARYGTCVQAMALYGVHLGIKGGRTSGIRLGYSQIANPVYLLAQGTMTRGHVCRMIARNLSANAAKSLRPEPWVDRRGRLRGNFLALADLIRGRIAPGNVMKIGPNAGRGPDVRR
ncbi:MAG: family 2 glycosyl transferase [Paracoccus sp. (in: a-proteobacteria)]|nr:family 2 glycosyl transferase [Paracoccus sp. (in: a-proteobacteria)]